MPPDLHPVQPVPAARFAPSTAGSAPTRQPRYPAATYEWSPHQLNHPSAGHSAGPSSQPGGALDLAPFGAPGCSLLISPDLLYPVFNWAGYANWSFAIPNDTTLQGLAFYNQAIAIDHTNQLGLVFTNGGSGVIGNL